MTAPPRRARLVRIAGLGVFALLALYRLLLIPERAPPVPVGAGREPFAWQRDAFWNQLEAQLRVVAEWRDPQTLFKDHVDNAVIDVLLESAESGEQLGHDWARLPFARLAKGWSWVLNCCGGGGPIPEGMSATTALRVQRLKALHAGLATGVLSRAEAFKAERGYTPPYWELVRFAREARR